MLTAGTTSFLSRNLSVLPCAEYTVIHTHGNEKHGQPVCQGHTWVPWQSSVGLFKLSCSKGVILKHSQFLLFGTHPASLEIQSKPRILTKSYLERKKRRETAGGSQQFIGSRGFLFKPKQLPPPPEVLQIVKWITAKALSLPLPGTHHYSSRTRDWVAKGTWAVFLDWLITKWKWDKETQGSINSKVGPDRDAFPQVCSQTRLVRSAASWRRWWWWCVCGKHVAEEKGEG